MRKKLNSILLIDDNKATNFIHKKFINISGCAEHVVDFQSGHDALDFLRSKSTPPELIFVDINMPIMDAWEFLDEYKKLELEKRDKSKLIMLTTSLSPSDLEKAKEIDIVQDVKIKPLSVESINQVIEEYFP